MTKIIRLKIKQNKLTQLNQQRETIIGEKTLRNILQNPDLKRTKRDLIRVNTKIANTMVSIEILKRGLS